MQAKSPSSSLTELPNELLGDVVGYLSFPDNLSLKHTCQRFNGLINFDHSEQIEAENTVFAEELSIYTCVGCQRLRHHSKFADNMLMKKRRRGGRDAPKRFCMECGIGITNSSVQGYSPANHITVRGEGYVVCSHRRLVRLGRQVDQSFHGMICHDCTSTSQSIHEQEQVYRMATEQVIERAQQRNVRELSWDSGSDEYRGEDDAAAMFWEEQLDMIQAEAALYMNSPGAGSD